VKLELLNPNFCGSCDYSLEDYIPYMFARGDVESGEFTFAIPVENELKSVIDEIAEDMSSSDALVFDYQKAISNKTWDSGQSQQVILTLYTSNKELIGVAVFERKLLTEATMTDVIEDPLYKFTLNHIYILKEHRSKGYSDIFIHIFEDIASHDFHSVKDDLIKYGAPLLASFSAMCVSERGESVATEAMYKIDSLFRNLTLETHEDDGIGLKYIGMESLIDS